MVQATQAELQAHLAGQAQLMGLTVMLGGNDNDLMDSPTTMTSSMIIFLTLMHCS